MLRTASFIPEEGRLLCEGCGYILTGLDPDSLCPECAQPIAESLPERREPPLWERPNTGRWFAFRATTAAVIFRTSRFYRRLSTRNPSDRSVTFARIHTCIASALFAAAGVLHLNWLLLRPATQLVDLLLLNIGLLAGGFTVTYLALSGTARLAGRLTSLEAAYRGFRLPHAVVVRGLHYHAAHYLPVALAALGTVGGYQILLLAGAVDDRHATYYIYALCGQVVLSAAYLFQAYWAAMRSMLYANG